MRIGLRGGHSKNAIGAVSLRNEYECMQELYKYTRDVLEKYGHEVIDCNSNAITENAELSEGASKANKIKIDYFLSLHMNCSNGNGNGTEAYVYNKYSKAKYIAQRLVNNFAELGLQNRGVKYNSSYYEMKNINAPNIIFETLFCDNEKDINIWSPTPYIKMAHLIANAFDINIPKEVKEDVPESEDSEEKVYYRVVAGSYKNRENAKKLANELKSKGYDAFIDVYSTKEAKTNE